MGRAVSVIAERRRDSDGSGGGRLLEWVGARRRGRKRRRMRTGEGES